MSGLETAEKFANASRLLQTFDIRQLLRTAEICSKKGVKFDVDSFLRDQKQNHSVSPCNEVTPIRATVSGRNAPCGLDASTSFLEARVSDDSGRLGPLGTTLESACSSADSMKKDERPNPEKVQRRDKSAEFSLF